MEYNSEKILKKENLNQKGSLNYIKSANKLCKKKAKIIITISTIILIVIVIKFLLGTIELYNVFGYPSSKSRYYKVTVNGTQVEVSYIFRNKVPIIPFLINFNSYYLGNSYIEGNNIGTFFYADGSENYFIDIASYKCYYNDIQMECKSNSQTMKENTDEKLSRLTITRITNPYEKIYDGDYINDIAPYVKDKGEYHIEITSIYGLNETKIYYYFITK